MARLDPLLRLVRQAGGTDLHLTAGAQPRVRVRGELEPVPQAPITAEELDAGVRELLTREEADEFLAHRDVEFSCGIAGEARFRASYFMTAAGPAAVFRLAPEVAVPWESLGIPPAFEALLGRRSGLLFLAVPGGSGRSTLIASVVERARRFAPRVLVTLESPVEVLHPPAAADGSVVVQREIGRDTRSFAQGIQDALRSDADVLLVGELADAAATRLAFQAAEGGRLVIAFPAVPGAAQALERLVEMFPAGEQAEARALLADNLLGVLSQVLLRRKNGPEKVPAHELLLCNADLASTLRDGEMREVESVLDAARGQGMMTLDDSIEVLLKAGAVSVEEAHRKAFDKRRFV